MQDCFYGVVFIVAVRFEAGSVAARAYCWLFVEGGYTVDTKSLPKYPSVPGPEYFDVG